MAGLKKPTTRRNPDNPNTVLVVFLVFFVLLSIGLGLWAYFAYKGQDKLRETTISEKATAKAAQLGEEYQKIIALDTLAAIGQPLEPDDLAFLKNANDGKALESKFKDEKSLPAIKKMIDDNHARLGFDGSKYASTYKDRLAKLDADVKKAQADFAKALDDFKKEQDKNRARQASFDDFWKKALGQIDEGNKASLAAARARNAQIEEAFKRNADLQERLAKMDADHQVQVAKLQSTIRDLDANLKKAKDRAIAANPGFVPRASSEPHALALDISRGRTLWDEPVGKISRIDFLNRQVSINVGSALGVQPELTFNVFGAGWKGKAEGPFKGTIEVIRVLGPAASQARITSLYDSEGNEIHLSDPGKGRILREADNPFKEGDLLFNLAFGTRVVLAGNINWTGYASDAPAEQVRNLQDFMHLLRRQGVRIDGYVDLTNGEFKGSITTQTRYFIRGDLLVPPPKGKLSDHGMKINEILKAVRADAIEKGLFIISAENFANVIGYRRPRIGSDLELSKTFKTFTPGQPSAGTADR